MPNRQQSQNQPQKGRGNPMQTSPDDDEAQVEDQTHLADEEMARDERSGRARTDAKRRALQPSQEREEERMAQGGEDDDDLVESDDDDEDEVGGKGNLSGM